MAQLTVESERVVEAAKSCPDAKRVLQTLFPAAFEENDTYLRADATLALAPKRSGSLNGMGWSLETIPGRRWLTITTEDKQQVLVCKREGR